MCLDGAPIDGVGARDLNRLEDVVKGDAAVVTSGNGAHMAIVLLPELVMAR